MSTTNTGTNGRPRISRLAGPANYLDERLGLAGAMKKNLRKVFPDHWSFMLGEIALWSFVVLLLTGVFLSFWFKPSMAEVEYMGSYAQLRGLEMSEAYASTLELSFDIRGGLLMRQMHHWSALMFIAAMFAHMMRIMFTGAYRKPRELNYLIGISLLVLGILEGFAGYSLPDDLLSGTGLRIADGLIKSIPVIGTYTSFFVFGGEFPGNDFIPRLYVAHVLLIPGLLLGLIAAHMLLLVYHKHTQWPGPGRTNDNVVGYPMLPVYAAKAGGFFFVVFGVTALMGGILQINGVWGYGPYNPAEVTAGSQPDWYMGVAEGLLRVMPGWETEFLGFTLSWNVLIPGVLAPGVLLTAAALLPFIEQWITGDKREHHLLDRPRNAPTRSAVIVALMTLFGLMWLGGANDIVAVKFNLNLNHITWFLRAAVFILPIVAFIVTRRWCISLQRHDNEMLLHGLETGIIMRSADGEYTERHLPLDPARAYTITARDRDVVHELPPGVDANGVVAPGSRKERLRARLSEFWNGHNVQKPTRAEIQAAHHDGHAGEDHVPADGHQFDGREVVEGHELRSH